MPGQPQIDEKETDLEPGPAQGLDGALPLPALVGGWGLLAM